MARKNKVNISEDKKKKCMAIIHGAATTAGATGTGLAQIPLADNAVITPIQVVMIVALGKVFDLEIKDSAARAIISGAGASLVGRGVSQLLWGWIPGVGNAINTATAAGLTEAIGWMAVDKFAKEYNEQISLKLSKHANVHKDEASDDETFKDLEETDEIIDEARKFMADGKSRKTYEDEYKKILAGLEKILQGCSEDSDIFKRYRPIYEDFLKQ